MAGHRPIRLPEQRSKHVKAGVLHAISLVWAGSEYAMAWHDDRDANFEIYFSRVGCCTDADLDGFSACQNDCNDGDPGVNPSAIEVCDEIDNDCDGAIDEDFPTPGPVVVVQRK